MLAPSLFYCCGFCSGTSYCGTPSGSQYFEFSLKKPTHSPTPSPKALSRYWQLFFPWWAVNDVTGGEGNTEGDMDATWMQNQYAQLKIVSFVQYGTMRCKRMLLSLDIELSFSMSLFALYLIRDGLDQLRPGLLQSQKSFIQSPQQYHQLQMLSPHQQQILMQAQAQGNLTSASGSNLNDVESRRLRMLLSNRNVVTGKDGQPNAVGDVAQNVGSPMQAASPVPRPEADILLKISCGHLYASSKPSN
eukprot:Gb_10347 [translate_table: standard]